MSRQLREDARNFLMKIQRSKKKDLPSGQLLDALIEDRKNVLDLNIIVCIDISGSICQQQFKQFMSQIEAIKGLSRVKVIEIDTEVCAFYDYFKMPQKRVIRLNGGGGTEFTPAFELIEKVEPDAVLFMTDGMVAGNVKKPKCPVGWILTSNGVHPYGWGEVVTKLPSPR